MPIERGEVNFYQSNPVTGVMSKSRPVGDNILAQIIADITDAERAAGVERTAKIFWNFEDAENLTAKSPLLYLFKPLTGDTVASLVYATHTDLWADVVTDQKCGCANVAAGASLTAGVSTSVVVNTRGVEYDHFVAGMKVVVTDKSDIDDLTGNSEVLSLQSVSWNGDQATLTFTAPVKYSYAESRVVGLETVNTRVSSAVEFEDIKSEFTVSNKNSVHGTTLAAQLLPRNLGAISQTITITFDSANNFSAVSNIVGALTAGSKLTTWQPTDDNGNPYLAIPASFWTNDGNGDWAAGDSVQIHTTPAALRFFLHIDVPQDAAPVSLEVVDIFAWFYSGSA